MNTLEKIINEGIGEVGKKTIMLSFDNGRKSPYHLLTSVDEILSTCKQALSYLKEKHSDEDNYQDYLKNNGVKFHHTWLTQIPEKIKFALFDILEVMQEKEEVDANGNITILFLNMRLVIKPNIREKVLDLLSMYYIENAIRTLEEIKRISGK